MRSSRPDSLIARGLVPYFKATYAEVDEGEQDEEFVTPKSLKRKLEEFVNPGNAATKAYVDGKFIDTNIFRFMRILGPSYRMPYLLLNDTTYEPEVPDYTQILLRIGSSGSHDTMAHHIIGTTSGVNVGPSIRANTYLVWLDKSLAPATSSLYILEADEIRINGLLNASNSGVTLPSSSYPLTDYQAATKKYVDDGLALKLDSSAYLPISQVQANITSVGITLPSSGYPSSNYHAATKKYADDALALKLNMSAYNPISEVRGDILSTGLTLPSSSYPLTTYQAATKGYVDTSALSSQAYTDAAIAASKAITKLGSAGTTQWVILGDYTASYASNTLADAWFTKLYGLATPQPGSAPAVYTGHNTIQHVIFNRGPFMLNAPGYSNALLNSNSRPTILLIGADEELFTAGGYNLQYNYPEQGFRHWLYLLLMASMPLSQQQFVTATFNNVRGYPVSGSWSGATSYNGVDWGYGVRSNGTGGTIFGIPLAQSVRYIVFGFSVVSTGLTERTDIWKVEFSSNSGSTYTAGSATYYVPWAPHQGAIYQESLQQAFIYDLGSETTTTNWRIKFTNQSSPGAVQTIDWIAQLRDPLSTYLGATLATTYKQLLVIPPISVRNPNSASSMSKRELRAAVDQNVKNCKRAVDTLKTMIPGYPIIYASEAESFAPNFVVDWTNGELNKWDHAMLANTLSIRVK